MDPIRQGLLTRQEVAERLRITPEKVRRLHESKKLRGRRMGRCVYTTEKALEDYLNDPALDDYVPAQRGRRGQPESTKA